MKCKENLCAAALEAESSTLPARGNMRWQRVDAYAAWRDQKEASFGFGATQDPLLKGAHVNVTDASTGKTSKADIDTVELNGANRNYVRRNIITKGAVVQTTLASESHQPTGQDGSINAILLAEQ